MSTESRDPTAQPSVVEAVAAVSARSSEGLAAVRHDVDGAGQRSRQENAWRHRAEAAERRVTGLEDALGTRATVEQATGLVMGVFGLDAVEAADVLVWVADHADAELPAVAERLLLAVRSTDFGASIVEQLTHLLADLAHGATGAG